MLIRSLSLVWILTAWYAVSGQTCIHSEILGQPSDKGIHICAIFDTTVQTRIIYGIESGVYQDTTSWQTVLVDNSHEAVMKITLESLLPDTRYFYRLQYKLSGDNSIIQRPESQFQTARPTGSSFTFTIEADPHLDYSSDTALFRLCLKNQSEDHPDFMIDLGDFLMTDKLKNSSNQVPEDTIPYRCKLLRSYYESVCHSIPLFLVMGNHEGECGWYQNNTSSNIAVWNTLYRKKYFSNPTPDSFYSGDTAIYPFVGQREAYYSWTWGDALFIVLDPYWNTVPKPDSAHGWRWTLGKTQYDWLKTTLENSGATFKFLFCHQLVGGDKDGRGGIERAEFNEWGGKNLDGTEGWSLNRPGWYKPIKDLLAENRVTIFFHGHDHLYAKQDLDCLVYQEVPQPSLPNFQGVPQASDYGYLHGTILPNSGHLRVQVSPEHVKVEYVRAYLPAQETATRHNKDIGDAYVIGRVNCYDSIGYNLPEPFGNPAEIISLSPNPFTERVYITINPSYIQEGSRIVIVDMQGRIIRTLIPGKLNNEGVMETSWDGRDQSGCKVPGGIYFCTLNNSNSGNKKIIFYP